jgi:hypothetical protein
MEELREQLKRGAITAAELAWVLGVSPATARSLINKQLVPSILVGASRRVPMWAVRKLLQEDSDGGAAAAE